MNGIHGALAQTVRERLDPTDPAVARWLDVVDPDDNPLWPTNIQPPPPPLSAVLREAQDAAKDAADHNGGADQQGRGVQP
ncbi:MAG: hypothetical protein HZC41_21975 [Chloroflexi bacterium]|nr:hypothetical protein [Chloroflexota bacterium]